MRTLCGSSSAVSARVLIAHRGNQCKAAEELACTAIRSAGPWRTGLELAEVRSGSSVRHAASVLYLAPSAKLPPGLIERSKKHANYFAEPGSRVVIERFRMDGQDAYLFDIDAPCCGAATAFTRILRLQRAARYRIRDHAGRHPALRQH